MPLTFNASQLLLFLVFGAHLTIMLKASSCYWLSVCLSVRLSNACFVTKWNNRL